MLEKKTFKSKFKNSSWLDQNSLNSTELVASPTQKNTRGRNLLTAVWSEIVEGYCDTENTELHVSPETEAQSLRLLCESNKLYHTVVIKKNPNNGEEAA